MNDPISRNRGKPSARRHAHPEFGGGARAPLTCQRSTHAQDWSLSVRLPSQRRLLRPEFNRRASNCEDRPVPERVPRQRRLLSWAERRSSRRASGRRMPGRLSCERRVLPLEQVEHESAQSQEGHLEAPPARFPASGCLVGSEPTKPLYGHSCESESHSGWSRSVPSRSEPTQPPDFLECSLRLFEALLGLRLLCGRLEIGMQVDAIRLLDGLQDEVWAIFRQSNPPVWRLRI